MCRSFKNLQVALLSAGRLNKCRSLPRDPMVLPQHPLEIPTPPDDLAYDAVPVSLRAVCDDAVVHLDQIEHRGLPVLLADYRDGMAFLAQLDSSLDLGSIRTV